MKSLKGKTALVCGASRGIGRAIATELAREGARVVAMARTESRLQELVKDLEGSGHLALYADTNDLDGLGAKLNNLLKGLGAVHILVCNSGGPASGPLALADVVQLEKAFRSHVMANHIMLQVVLPGMKKAGFGRIVNVLSTSVKTPLPGLGVSNIIRAGVASWAKTLSLELAPFGITVNNILPGYTETDRLKELMIATAERQEKSVEQIEKQWRDSVPAGRFARAEEIAQAVSFLASPLAGYVNGINLPVDGGRTASL